MYRIDGKFIPLRKKNLVEGFSNIVEHMQHNTPSHDNHHAPMPLFQLNVNRDVGKVFLEKHPEVNITSLQWQRIISDGSSVITSNINNMISNPIPTDLEYILTDEDVNSKIGVRISYSDIKDLHSNNIDPPPPEVSITGNTSIGGMLYVNTSNMDSDSLIYKWEYADTPDSTSWTEVSGNDNPSLTINTNMLGKHVRVTVNGSFISQAVSIPSPPFATISSSESANILKLTANSNIENPTYQWILNDSNGETIIYGANAQDYMIDTTDTNYNITNRYKVKVTNFNDSSITATSSEYSAST